jgi:hypothetical protein
LYIKAFTLIGLTYTLLLHTRVLETTKRPLAVLNIVSTERLLPRDRFIRDNHKTVEEHANGDGFLDTDVNMASTEPSRIQAMPAGCTCYLVTKRLGQYSCQGCEGGQINVQSCTRHHDHWQAVEKEKGKDYSTQDSRMVSHYNTN